MWSISPQSLQSLDARSLTAPRRFRIFARAGPTSLQLKEVSGGTRIDNGAETRFRIYFVALLLVAGQAVDKNELGTSVCQSRRHQPPIQVASRRRILGPEGNLIKTIPGPGYLRLNTMVMTKLRADTASSADGLSNAFRLAQQQPRPRYPQGALHRHRGRRLRPGGSGRPHSICWLRVEYFGPCRLYWTVIGSVDVSASSSTPGCRSTPAQIFQAEALSTIVASVFNMPRSSVSVWESTP